MISRKSLSVFASIALLMVSSVSVSAQPSQMAPQEMSFEMLITFIKQHSLEEAMPHMLELIKQLEEKMVESAGHADELLKDMLAQCYFTLSEYHYNRFLDNRTEDDSRLALDYGRKLRNLVPNHTRALVTLQFEISIFEVVRDWISLRASLQEGLQGIDEGHYPAPMRLKWLESICYTYAVQKEWGEGLEFFKQTHASNFVSYRLKALTALYMIQAYESLEQPLEAIPLVAFLNYLEKERYDPSLNFSLFKLGNQLSDLGEYSYANYMYFLCLTIEEIIEYNEGLLQSLKNQLNTNPNEENRPELLDEVSRMSDYIRELGALQTYTGPLKYQRALNLRRMGRVYDAFFAYRRLVYEHPEHGRIELFHYTSFNQANEINYLDEVIELGESYLATEKYKNYRPQVFVKLIATYFKLERYDRVHALGRMFVNEYPEHEYGNNIVHYMGYGWMRLGQYEESRSNLTGYLEEYPNAPMAQAAHYWVGMGAIIEQEFEAASLHFDKIIEFGASGNFYIEARFRRAVCDFGMGDYDAAQGRFEQWVVDYPDNHLRAEGEMFLGDIDAYNARIEPALAHYTRIREYTDKMNLIDHSYFESAKLYEVNKMYQEVIALLTDYMDRYAENGNLPRAIYQIGSAYELLGQPAVLIQTYYDAIQKYGNNPNAEGVDEIFKSFIDKYDYYKKRYTDTMRFLQKLIDNTEFRLSMIGDRKALHLYRLKNPTIDQDLMDLLIRNEELRVGMGRREIPQTKEDIAAGAPVQYDTKLTDEARAQLTEMLEKQQANIDQLPKETPDEQLRDLYVQAKHEKQRTLELRILAAYDQLGLPKPGSTTLTVKDLPHASPSTLVWMANAVLNDDIELADIALNQVIEQNPDSIAMPAALRTKARIFEMNGSIDKAIQVLMVIQNNYPTWEEAPAIALHTADLEYERGAYDAALNRYLEVLQVRDWRGAPWAEACYKIGQVYEKTGEQLKAHGFYERTYLTYRQFPEWTGKAYFSDGKLLESMNELDSAKNVYQAYLNLPNASTLHDYNAVKSRYEALQ